MLGVPPTRTVERLPLILDSVSPRGAVQLEGAERFALTSGGSTPAERLPLGVQCPNILRGPGAERLPLPVPFPLPVSGVMGTHTLIPE